MKSFTCATNGNQETEDQFVFLLGIGLFNSAFKGFFEVTHIKPPTD